MENRVMEPIIDEVLSHVFPPLPEMDEMLLAESIKENGVINPFVIWKGKGILVDGHNRFKICKELGIPYCTRELEFADVNVAKTWMIKNQLGRRNVNAFVKVELVLPLRDSLLEEGRRKQGWRKNGFDVFQNSEKRQNHFSSIPAYGVPPPATNLLMVKPAPPSRMHLHYGVQAGSLSSTS